MTGFILHFGHRMALRRKVGARVIQLPSGNYQQSRSAHAAQSGGSVSFGNIGHPVLRLDSRFLGYPLLKGSSWVTSSPLRFQFS